MDISSYQLRGLASTFFRAATPMGGEVATANSFMTDLGGPILDGLADGRYLAFWGANFATQGGDSVGLMGLLAQRVRRRPTNRRPRAARSTTPDFIPMFYTREFTLDGRRQQLR